MIDNGLSQQEWELLVKIADDYHGLYAIPFEYFQDVIPGHQPDDEVSPEVRHRLEVMMSEIYEKLLKNGWIDVFSFNYTKNEAKKFDMPEALDAIRELKNYDWKNVTNPYIAVSTSPIGVELIEQNKHKYRDKTK